MKFLIAERISANKYKTPEGYLVCVDSVLARTGKQTYRKNEIFVDCNDDTEIEVDRRPEEVFSEATLASFENKPITIEHPDEDVNTGNFKNLAVGFVRDIHRGKDNGQDVMLGTLVITDEEAISAVESGELLDLSCGYDCDIEDSANPQQRNIRGNHVALCEKGRAGIARIVDSIDDATMKEYIFKFIPDEFTSKPVEVRFPCLSNAAALATLRRSWSWIKMISVTVDGKEVKYQNGKIIDSEETEMKDKLIDIPSDILGKIESLFKSRNIKITGKGKTWTGRVHYQVEFVGKAIDLKKKLDLIEKQVETLKIPMTYAIGNNKEDTLATAGVDFDKQYVADSDVEDVKEYRIFVNGSERVKWEANSAEEAVKEFIEANPAYANHKKGKVEARDSDELISDANLLWGFKSKSEAEQQLSKLNEAYQKAFQNTLPSNIEVIHLSTGWFITFKKNLSQSSANNLNRYLSGTKMFASTVGIGMRDSQFISDDEDLITKAINDEVTAIELYNQILAGDLDDETRAIIEEIRDDENDHLVKLTKLKNNVGSDEDIEDSASEFNKYLARIEKAAKNKDKKLLAEVKQAVMYAPTSRLKNSESSELFDKIKKIEKSISDEEKVDDAMQTFEIRWIDTYKKSKGYGKDEYLHIDKVKANTLSEALKKLADDVALAGVGTMNAMIVSIHSDKASYMYSGKLGELVKKVKDSSKIERAVKAISAMRKF